MAQVEDIRDIVAEFPAIIEQAQATWAKFKIAHEAGLMPPQAEQQIIDWFWEFPQLWDGIRPHFEIGTDENPASPERRAFAEKVNRWIVRLRGEPELQSKLGVVPLIIIAGIAVAAAFGVAGVTYAVGYLQKQRTNDNLVNAYLEGKVPEEMVQAAIEEEQGGGPLSAITDTAKQFMVVVGIGIVGVMLAPELLRMVRSR